MPTGPNMHYDNEWMGESAGNLATIFAGDPKTRMMRDYYGSGALENEAQAAKANAEADFQIGRNTAQRQLTPELMAELADRPGEGPQAKLIRQSTLISALARMGINSNDIANAMHRMKTDAYAVDPTQQGKLAAMALSGVATDEDYSGTPGQAATVQGYKKAAGDSVANINKASALGVAGIQRAGAMDRQIEGGVKTSPGETVNLPKGGRAAKAMGGDIFTGLPTETTARGGAMDKYTKGNNDVRIRDIAFDTPPAGSPPKSKGQPVLVDQKKLDDILFVALRDVEGAIDNKGTTSESVNPRFRAMFDRATWADAESAASKMLQNNRTAREAADEFKRVAGMDNVTGMHKDSGWWGSEPDKLNYGTPAKVVLNAGNKTPPPNGTPPPQPNGAPQQTPAQPQPLAFDRSEILGSTTNAQGKEIYMVRDKNTNKKIWVDAQRHQVQ